MSADAVAADTVVSIHYKLSLGGEDMVDSSEGCDPLQYLHGHGSIVPGLESLMAGRKVGDQFSAKVTPEDGYGPHDPERIVQAPRAAFPSDVELAPGMQFQTEDEEGDPMMVRVTAVGEEEITIDMNHPLAGKTLSFEIEVAALRAATSEELEHGHAHGPGDGQDHD